jgi:tRNA G26 N,N-dimethylase Trm1
MQKEVPEGYQEVKEGRARILYIQEKMEKDANNKIIDAPGKKGKREANEVNETRGAVFYNPVQEFNRDTSIMAINEFN